jgi:putative copper resistance protein D
VSEWVLSGARLLQFASTLVLFGSALFFLYGWQRTTSVRAPAPSWARPLLAGTSALGVGSAIGWLLAETVALAGVWSAWRDVVTGTRFGEILAARTGLLALSLAATLAMRPGRTLWTIASVLGALSVASFVGTGHGTMGEGYAALWHAGADVLHLWLAGVWFGALVPLTILIVLSHRTQSAASAPWILDALMRFSAIGPAVVSVLTLTGLVNAWYLIGPAHWRSLFDAPYGWSLLVKLALFACMLALAAVNRLRLTPQLQTALASSAPIQSVVRRLRVSLLTETLLALLVLAAVSVLGTLEPPVSMSSAAAELRLTQETLTLRGR